MSAMMPSIYIYIYMYIVFGLGYRQLWPIFTQSSAAPDSLPPNGHQIGKKNMISHWFSGYPWVPYLQNMSVYYIYIIYFNIYIQLFIHIFIYLFNYSTHTCMHIYIYTYTCVYTYIYIYKFIDTSICVEAWDKRSWGFIHTVRLQEFREGDWQCPACHPDLVAFAWKCRHPSLVVLLECSFWGTMKLLAFVWLKIEDCCNL